MSVTLERGSGFIADPPQRRAEGIGLAIVNQQGKLWVQQDVTGRIQTGRQAGLLSIPFETRKKHEPHRQNVLGAIPEVLDDETVVAAAQHLHTTDNLLSTPQLHFREGPTAISYSLAVVVYDGPNVLHFQPHVHEEAAPVGWMQPTELLDRDDVRPLARHAVGFLYDTELVERKLAEHHDPLYATQRVLPEGFVVSEFHDWREKAADMVEGQEYHV